MKHILSSIFIIVFLTPAFVQNKVECEEIVSIVFDAVSKQDIEMVKPFLSEDIEISDQSSPIAEKVLEQLVNSLGKIEIFTLIETNNYTTLRLNMKKLARNSLFLSSTKTTKYGKWTC